MLDIEMSPGHSCVAIWMHAERYGQKLVQGYPQFAGAWVLLGSIYQQRREFDKAIDSFKQGLQRQNESLDCLRGLLDSSNALHEPQEAKR